MIKMKIIKNESLGSIFNMMASRIIET